MLEHGGTVRQPVLRAAVAARSDAWRGMPAWPARYTVIEIATGEDHGTYDSEAEAAACLAFAKLSRDDVEIVSDESPISRYAAW